jgi:hypothetical protein
MAKVLRRLSDPPKQRKDCPLSEHCPDIFELDNDTFAVIGTLADADTLSHLIAGEASIAPNERAVVVPGPLFRKAAANLGPAPVSHVDRAVRAVADLLRHWFESIRALPGSWSPRPRPA